MPLQCPTYSKNISRIATALRVGDDLSGPVDNEILPLNGGTRIAVDLEDPGFAMLTQGGIIG